MGWSSKGLIVRVTMPSITPSLGFFFHLRARLWGRGGGVGVDVEHRWSVTVEGSAKELTQLVTRSPNGAGRPVSGRRVALRSLGGPWSRVATRGSCLLPLLL